MPKHLEMLLGQNRGWREDRDLFAIHNRFERGANRNLGLAKTDIAANQAVHRLRALHVDLHVDDRSQLIRRFAKRE